MYLRLSCIASGHGRLTAHGKAFTVTVQSLDRENDISARVFVDGAKVDDVIIRKYYLRERVVEGAIESATVVWPMRFAVIKTSGMYMTSGQDIRPNIALL